jgi:N-ethylmaleimide reductase
MLQRASKGGFIVSEGTTISPSAKRWFGAPGIYTDEQVAGSREISAAIHAKGASIFSQVWHTERASHIDTSGLTTIGRPLDLMVWNSIPAMAICRSVSAGRNEQAHGRLWGIN